MHTLVRRSHFRSRDKDGGHVTIRSAIGETPMYTQNSWLDVLYNRTYCRWKFYIAGMGFSTFFAVVTLILTRWPSYTNLSSIPWRYTGCANMKFLRQGFRKLSSDRQTDRQTDTTEITSYILRRTSRR